MENDWKDKLLQWCSVLCALCSVVVLLALYVFIAGESWPIWRDAGIRSILLNADWQPLRHPANFGLLTMFVSTLWSSLGAMFLAVPPGICCGIFLAEYAPQWLASVLQTILRLLTGIPSVVYGFLGASVIVPWYERVLGVPSGESLFCASLVLSVMVVPYIVAGTYAAYKSIPAAYREAGYMLGVSKVYLIARILTPLAYRGTVGAVTLAFGRAAGETMAVLMLAGNTLTIPVSWFSKGEPLSALIALEIGTAEIGSRQYQALFAAGLMLLLFVTSINFSINYLSSRRRD
ncbi:MAG: phosphate ABC transporter permease subunit PstC [Bacillota bacterium]